MDMTTSITAWAVYTHHFPEDAMRAVMERSDRPQDWAAALASGAPCYIGWCRAVDLSRSPDARAVVAWRALASLSPMVSVTVAGLYDDQRAALRAAWPLIARHNPPCNKSTARGSAVRCLETGELFPTATDAAQAMGVSDSYVSMHLNGKRPHVNGMHFERI